ncbi:MAG: hypothetical protein JSU72_07195 [Deltaproteobacteria bacterium]|nr:MAG: hypothetical protein JSU72_07195 [Deltaproteobacteria bacterium]
MTLICAQCRKTFVKTRPRMRIRKNKGIHVFCTDICRDKFHHRVCENRPFWNGPDLFHPHGYGHLQSLNGLY